MKRGLLTAFRALLFAVCHSMLATVGGYSDQVGRQRCLICAGDRHGVDSD